MSNTEQIKTDDAIFNAALSVLGEWPATRECSMRARMTMAADMQDRIMDTVNALLSSNKRSTMGRAAATKRWKKAQEKAAAPTTDAPSVPSEPVVTSSPEPQATKKRGRPRKVVAPEVGAVAPVPIPAVNNEAQAPVPAPSVPEMPAVPVPPIPPMPSAAPPAPSTNPFGTVQ